MDNIYILLFAVCAGIFFWLVLITLLFFSLRKTFQQLLGKDKTRNLEEILTQILSTQKRLSQENSLVKSKLKQIDSDSQYYLQKIGFSRFNPFSDTGGDQSFCLALLDNKKNGMVFTFLHSRDTTRVYAKKLLLGKSEKFPLSKEEEIVIASAASPKV